MTLKEEMQKTRDDAMMTEEEVTEMVQKVKEAFRAEQAKDLKESYFSFKTDLACNKVFSVVRGVTLLYPVGPVIKTEAQKQWILRNLGERLKIEGIEVKHEFEETKPKEENQQSKITKSHYSIQLL